MAPSSAMLSCASVPVSRISHSQSSDRRSRLPLAASLPSRSSVALNSNFLGTGGQPALRQQASRSSAVRHTRTPARTPSVRAASGDAGKKVLVVGATGGVGQLVVASLLEKGIPVRAVSRDAAKAASVLTGGKGSLEFASCDLRFPDQLQNSALFDQVGRVVLATGTTAFPSKRWQDNNGPEQTDYISVKNFLAACPKSLDRLVLISSVGVTRYNQLPYSILNLFGVLKYKRMAEEMVQTAGIPYTIFRPGRLTDGPYTSYDLNTLLKATSGLRKSVVVNKGDSLGVETSRIAVAEAAVQALFSDSAENQVFEIGSKEGPWPGSELGSWDGLFEKAPVV